MKDSVARFDVGEESVSETLSLTGAFDQTRDVHYIEKCGDFAVK